MQLEHERSDAIGYAIFPDSAQYVRSACLDWEWLFIKEFPEFKRTTVHIQAASEYKGSAFTCMGAQLGDNLKKNRIESILSGRAMASLLCRIVAYQNDS